MLLHTSWKTLLCSEGDIRGDRAHVSVLDARSVAGEETGEDTLSGACRSSDEVFKVISLRILPGFDPWTLGRECPRYSSIFPA